MRFSLKGIGAWGRGFQNWAELVRLCNVAESDVEPEWVAPAPEQIPKRERRRSPLLVKLAVEVAHQACAEAEVNVSSVASVFCSSMGDSDITDYMCRALAGPSKILSPTKFHNSVHNAPAGYWSISAENRSPSISVANGRESFPAALLEAAVVVETDKRPVLLVTADTAVEGPLADVFPIQEPFAAAMLMEPVRDGDSVLELTCRAGAAGWPEIVQPHLRALSSGNPSARCLALLEALATGAPAALAWPLGGEVHVAVETGRIAQ